MEDNDFGINAKQHRILASRLFNYTWELMEKERSLEDDELMISVAQASLFHWRFAGGKLEISRGHWIISRVYSILKMPESSLYHGMRDLTICEEENFSDFDMGFANEAVARAYSIKGSKELAIVYIKKAMEYAQKIDDGEDKNWLETNINTIII
ncbi:hypothetical protein [Ferroplasma sp.]|uniref:hypothetical protein n=1 Tax=Ferroplasma sp. TaxID=2591003 RepID=UPI00307D08CA